MQAFWCDVPDPCCASALQERVLLVGLTWNNQCSVNEQNFLNIHRNSHIKGKQFRGHDKTTHASQNETVSRQQRLAVMKLIDLNIHTSKNETPTKRGV
jgi:hypothetical protein